MQVVCRVATSHERARWQMRVDDRSDSISAFSTYQRVNVSAVLTLVSCGFPREVLGGPISQSSASLMNRSRGVDTTS